MNSVQRPKFPSPQWFTNHPIDALYGVLLVGLVTWVAFSYGRLQLLAPSDPALALILLSTGLAVFWGITTLQLRRQIRQREPIEAALRQKQEQFQAILDHSPALIHVKNLQGRFLLINRQLEQVLQLEPAQILGKTTTDFFPKELAATLQAHDRQVLDSQAFLEFQETIPLADGSVHTYLSLKFPLFDPAGVLYALCGLSYDITEQKQAQELLQQSEERFRRAVMEAPFPAMIHASDGRVIALSKTWTEISGYTQADIPTVADWIALAYGERPNTEPLPLDPLHDSEPAIAEGDFAIYTKSGAMRVWQFSSTPLGQLSDGRRIVISMATDVTDRNQLEQSLRRQSEALAQANQLKDDFLAIVSHELRSPLNSILGWATLLRSRSFNPERMTQALEVIERNARAQSKLIDDLLDISRLIRGKVRLALQPLELIPLLQAAIHAIRPAAEAKQIHLEAELSTNLTIAGDLERTQQIIWNLLSNAIKFTPNGGQVTVQLDCVERTRETSPGVFATFSEARIQIIDTGKGIHPDFLPYVFDRFRQADSSTTRSSGGLGLGLAIVYQLVELQGGSVEAESAGEGQGATFRVWFPVLEPEPTIEPNPATIPAFIANTDPVLSLDGLRVLIVDDIEDTRQLLSTILTQAGAIVMAAADAHTAIEALIQFTPHILVSDIGMPGQNGYALISQIRSLELSQENQIPAIALTAYVRDEDQKQALQSGFQQHLSKPVDPDELIHTIGVLTGRLPSLAKAPYQSVTNYL